MLKRANDVDEAAQIALWWEADTHCLVHEAKTATGSPESELIQRDLHSWAIWVDQQLAAK